jgi:hypothetical protein
MNKLKELSDLKLWGVTGEHILSLNIAILYPAFFWKLARVVSGISKMELATRNTCEGRKNYWECREEIDNLMEKPKKLFFAMMIVGCVVAIILASRLNSESSQIGLMVGGVVSLIIGISTYWYYMGDEFRMIVLGLALGVMIYLASKITNKK